MLDFGSDVNKRNAAGVPPIFLAIECEGDRTDIVRLLLDRGADVDTLNETCKPFSFASGLRKMQIMIELASRSANVDVICGAADGKSDLTPLLAATYARDVDVIGVLLKECHASPCAANSKGVCALHLAVANNFFDIATLLITYAEQQKKDTLSTSINMCEYSQFLLNQKLNDNFSNDTLKHQVINATDFYGKSPLLIAAEHGNIQMVRLLLYNDALVDAEDGDGDTSLHVSTVGGHQTIVEMLLKQGANPNLRNNAGDVPSSIAKRLHFETIYRLLREAER